MLNAHVADSGIKNGAAAFAGQFETAKNGSLVHEREPSRGVDSDALRQQFDNAGEVLYGQTHFIKRLVLLVAECASALKAAITLDFLEAIATILLRRRLAEMTGHWEPCLSQAVGSQWL